MFGFLTVGGTNERNPLLNQAAEQFSRSLPRDDPLKTLKALCEALSTLTNRPDPDIDQLGVLLILDRSTERLCEQLLTNSVERGLRSWPPENTIWQSVLELSCAFGRAYQHFLQHMREKTSSKAWLERRPSVLLNLFRHRQVETLLALFRYEQLGPRRWHELHEAYQFAHLQSLSKRLVQTGHHEGRPGARSTLERQYLHILLLQLMNNGQFTPREAFWARQWITGWCRVLSLESPGTNGHFHVGDEGFVVDLVSAEGLKRPRAGLSKTHFYLDPTPMLVLIDDEIKSLRDSGTGASGSGPVVRTAQLALLAKLKILFSPKPVRIERRGERKTSALMTTQVFAGLSCIIRTLHDESQKTVVTPSLSVPDAEEITITDAGGCWRTAAATASDDTHPGTLPVTEAHGPLRHVWRVKDRSESGTLLRGRVDDPNRIIPGSLVVFRDRDDAQWTVAVVRRLKRFLRNNVEIGVEHIGQNLQGVTIVADRNRDFPAGLSMEKTHERFAALYLRESAGYPNIPFKTLLLPAREFKSGRGMTLLSTTTSYTLRLKRSLESQAEFVWTAFEVISKRTADSATDVAS